MPETKTAEVKLGAWLDRADPLMEEYGIIAARIEAKKATMEVALAKVRAAHEPALRFYEGACERLQQKLEKLSTTYKDEFPATNLRSYFHAGVRIGFRETPPRVHIKRNYSEIALAWLLKKFGEDVYVRVRREINKEAVRDKLIAAGKDPAMDNFVEDFRERGITLKSDDVFYVEIQKAQ